MSNRVSPLSAEQQADVGAQIDGLRLAGWCWKRIEDWLDMSHAQTWRCHKRYLMKQNSSGMKHHGAGNPG